jgi:hypothetical protein
VVCGHTHQYSNAPHRVGLLRARHKRPCGGAAEQRDDLAALHDGHRLSSHTDARLYQPATAVAQSVCRISSLPMEGSARVVALARERADVWVIRVAPTGSKASPNVRYAFNGDRNQCVATNRRRVPGPDIAQPDIAQRACLPIDHPCWARWLSAKCVDSSSSGVAIVSFKRL